MNDGIYRLRTDQICYEGDSNTGRLFAHCVIAYVSTPDHYVKIVYDWNGKPLLYEELVSQIGNYYSILFQPGFIDGEECFLSVEPRFKS